MAGAAHYRQHTLPVDAASSGNPRGSAQKHFHTDATTGRRCESAFALLSHQKVTKRLPYR